MPHKFLDLRGRLPIESEISLTAFYSPFRDECVNIRIVILVTPCTRVQLSISTKMNHLVI